jgi:hypothetical protein
VYFILGFSRLRRKTNTDSELSVLDKKKKGEYCKSQITIEDFFYRKQKKCAIHSLYQLTDEKPWSLLLFIFYLI